MEKKEKRKKEAQEEQPSFFKELGRFMTPYRATYAASVMLSILAVASQLLSYVFLGKLAAILFDGGFESFWLFAALAALGRILYAVLLNASTWLSHKAAYKTLGDIRHAMSEKMLRMPMGYFEEKGSGRIKTLLTDQVEAIEKPLAHVLPELTAEMLVPLALIIWLFFLDWRLALVATLWIILGFSVTGGMMKDYPEKFAGQLKAMKGMNQAISEYVGGIEVIKNFGQGKRCSELYEDAVTEHAEYNISWQKETLVWSSLGMAIAPFSLFPVLIAGLIFFAHGTLAPSVLAFAILLVMGIFGPLMAASGYFDQLASLGTIAKEMNGILEHEELVRGEEAAVESPDIEFRNVSFSYGSSNEDALKDISFSVPSGSSLALVGPSGSGKSTIAKLLAGFWDIRSGEILIGGKSINSYSEKALSEMIALVDQDTFLFPGTIRDNIRFARPDASDEEVEEVARLAGCDAFIRALPDGYETDVGSAGGALSGGERQRIAILRAMMKDSPIIILDEATASADPENEALIQESLSAAAKGRTLVMIAHHLKTIEDADQIAYVEDGRISAIGKHSDLLENSPGYRKLWELGKEEC